MPVIYKEKVEYAYTDPGVKAHTLSWAEYQALPTAQKMNGDLYFIPDKQPEGNPSRIWAKLGTEPLDTQAEDVSGAVNELNSSLASKITLKEFHSNTVTLYTDTDYTDYHYIFTQTYSRTPRVVLDLFTDTGTRNNVPVAVITAISTTSVKVRVWKQVGVPNTSGHNVMANPQLNIAVFGN